MRQPLESALFVMFEDCRRCRELGLDVRPATPFGLQVSHGGVIRGIWSERDGKLAFRNLASWHFRTIAETPEEALETTIAMAEQNGWLG